MPDAPRTADSLEAESRWREHKGWPPEALTTPPSFPFKLDRHYYGPYLNPDRDLPGEPTWIERH